MNNKEATGGASAISADSRDFYSAFLREVPLFKDMAFPEMEDMLTNGCSIVEYKVPCPASWRTCLHSHANRSVLSHAGVAGWGGGDLPGRARTLHVHRNQGRCLRAERGPCVPRVLVRLRGLLRRACSGEHTNAGPTNVKPKHINAKPSATALCGLWQWCPLHSQLVPPLTRRATAGERRGPRGDRGRPD